VGVEEGFLNVLRQRFEWACGRFPLDGVVWERVVDALRRERDKLTVLRRMEETGGEPCLVAYVDDEYVFMDCSDESPKGRRNLCYDREAEKLRKGVKPRGNVLDMAKSIGVEVLTEEQYRWLQSFSEFDLRTSSWLKTPEKIRKLGGAIYGQRRYDTVFIGANSAQSFYGSRGFRGLLRV
jgi:hypothetical protein